MASDEDSPPDTFPFLSLPTEIQGKILARLPVSDLIPCLSVSRAFPSLFCSPNFPSPPPDTFFLLFSKHYSPPFNRILSFHPASGRWIYLPTPRNSTFPSSGRPLATSSSLAITLPSCYEYDLHEQEVPTGESLLAVRMFSRLPPQEIPPMTPIGSLFILAVVSVADLGPSGPSSEHFKIVADCYSRDGGFCQVYDSSLGKWLQIGEIPHDAELDHNTASINNSLYVRDTNINQLLRLDLLSYTWDRIVAMPEHVISPHLFAHEENIYVVAGFKTNSPFMIGFKVFLLVWGKNGKSGYWSEISMLSDTDDTLLKFREDDIIMPGDINVVNQNGLVCVSVNSCNGLLLFDARDTSWNWVPPLLSRRRHYNVWYGHATEMGLEVLRPFPSFCCPPTFPSPSPGLLFLLFSDRQLPPFNKILSFHPYSHRWICFPSHSYSALCSYGLPLATSSSLAITKTEHSKGKHIEQVPKGQPLRAVRMFSNRPPQEIPPMIPIGALFILAVVAVPDLAPSSPHDNFKIVADCHSRQGGWYCQVYDSMTREWSNIGKIPYDAVLDRNTAIINSSLYVHTVNTKQLLKFDVVSHTWDQMVAMPEQLRSPHLFAHENNLYVVAGFEDLGYVSGFNVFVFDWAKTEWRVISTLSDRHETFLKFTSGFGQTGELIKAVHKSGLVCVWEESLGRGLLLFHVRGRSWFWVPACSLKRLDRTWYGHAMEVGSEVLSVMDEFEVENDFEDLDT